MARMSIDDKVCRDPRITVLAELVGWSRRETVGCLVQDVWAICYDQETHLISERIIDAAAGFPGFAQAMIECDLASMDRSGKVRIGGAKERIEYLDHKKRAGREGGVKSGESRAKGPKQTSSSGEADVKQRGSTPQAAGNPPVPDPVPVPDSVPDPAPAPASDQVGEPPSPKARPRGTQLADDWVPDRSAVNLAAEAEAKAHGVDLRAQLIRMRNWAKAEGKTGKDWDARWRNWISDSKSRPRFSVNSNPTQVALDDLEKIRRGELE